MKRFWRNRTFSAIVETKLGIIQQFVSEIGGLWARVNFGMLQNSQKVVNSLQQEKLSFRNAFMRNLCRDMHYHKIPAKSMPEWHIIGLSKVLTGIWNMP